MSYAKDFGVPEYRTGYVWNSKAGNLATLANGTWQAVSGDIRLESVESRGWFLDGVAIPEWKEGAKSAIVLIGTVNTEKARFTFGGEASREIWGQLIAFVGQCDKHGLQPIYWKISITSAERKVNRQSWFVPVLGWEITPRPNATDVTGG
jgi:hypothetical protein